MREEGQEDEGELSCIQTLQWKSRVTLMGNPRSLGRSRTSTSSRGRGVEARCSHTDGEDSSWAALIPRLLLACWTRSRLWGGRAVQGREDGTASKGPGQRDADSTSTHHGQRDGEAAGVALGTQEKASH